MGHIANVRERRRFLVLKYLAGAILALILILSVPALMLGYIQPKAVLSCVFP